MFPGWDVAVDLFNRNAIDVIADPSEHPPDPGHMYVQVKLKGTNTSGEEIPRKMFQDLSFYLVGDANVLYGPVLHVGKICTPQAALPGGTVTSDCEVFMVPENELDSLLLVVSDDYNPSFGTVVRYFSLK